jgi:hypothetical protein
VNANATPHTSQHEGEDEFPRSWIWHEDGSRFDARIDRITTGTSAFGTRPILEGKLTETGERIGLWLNEDAVRGRIADEIKKRPKRRLESGERVVITRGDEKRPSKTNPDRLVWPFSVRFPEAPELDQLAALGEVDDADKEPEEPAGDEPDGDIPF